MKRRLLATKQWLRRIAVGGILITVTLSTSSSRTRTILEQVVEEQTLRLITFVGPSTYFENAKGPNGFEYFLAKAFADSLGAKLEVTLIDDLNALFNAVGGPRGHLAGTGLTVTPKREQFLHFSDAYSTERQTVVYRLGEARPKSIEDLIDGDLIVVANSSHEERLIELQQDHPGLTWQSLRNTQMLDLMQQVHDGEADYALVDSTAFAINRNLYPKARVAFELSEEEAVAWAFPNHGDMSLIKSANRFLHDFEVSGKLEALKKQYYGNTNEFSVGGSQLFMSRINQRLGNYQALFERVAREYQLDWYLLAAMAYQESHWDPQATSPTGVRGLMMLTQDTAAELKVTDLLDPEQSIRGGAQYLVNILQTMPDDIEEPDRTWLALAAYNVGMGHLEDARVLTERAAQDPDLWQDIRQHLPLLEQKKYYQTVKHGFARGHEPVRYVHNIRHFKSILQWHQLQQARRNAITNDEVSAMANFHSDLVLPL